ncbi:helix-turn-helix domain-containing protein [Photobacterium frigidiphilum]|uniref:helix-turn-helix domain-containing protein n=1 Tax=Photobacterium frigidiphilum TaxID=264736 RepID=UPI003D13F94D
MDINKNKDLNTIGYLTILGVVIRNNREQKGLTRNELAEKLGLSERTLLRVEQASIPVTIDKLIKIAGALNLTPQCLLNQTDELKSTFEDAGFNVIFEQLDKDHDALKIAVLMEGKGKTGAIQIWNTIKDGESSNKKMTLVSGAVGGLATAACIIPSVSAVAGVTGAAIAKLINLAKKEKKPK